MSNAVTFLPFSTVTSASAVILFTSLS
jgi:hypothetical protein